MTSKVKVQVARSRDQSEPSWPNAVPVSLEVGGGISCRPNQAATLLVVAALLVKQYDNFAFIEVEFVVFVVVCNIAAISESCTSHVDCCDVPRQFLITGC